jgi:lysozyme
MRLKPYRDTEGYLTIGVGRNLDAKGISESEAMTLFQSDMADAARIAAQIPEFDALVPCRRAVLINMTYNMGKKVMQFKRMRTAMRVHNWDLAAAEMLDSKWAKQVGKRSMELSEQMRLGAWAEA